MQQNNSDAKKQVMYLGRWVDKEFFRAFVYRKGEQRLANSYEEFECLLATGCWFDSKENIPKDEPKRKVKNVTAFPNC